MNDLYERDRMHENIKVFDHVFKKKQRVNQRPMQMPSQQGKGGNGAGGRAEGKSDPNTWLESEQNYFPGKCGLTPFIFFCFPQ